MRPTLSRTEFLAITKLRPATFDQRVKVGEFCFAFGCRRTAHVNEYTLWDVVAFLLTSMIHAFSGLELKPSADIVCERWDDWLPLLVKTEHFPPPKHAQQFICIAWTSLDRSQPPRVLFGDHAEIAKALSAAWVVPTFVGMSFVLRSLRVNAAEAGIHVPKYLTPNPDDKPAYANWRRQIEDHRQAAGERVAKVKLAPA